MEIACSGYCQIWGKNISKLIFALLTQSIWCLVNQIWLTGCLYPALSRTPECLPALPQNPQKMLQLLLLGYPSMLSETAVAAEGGLQTSSVATWGLYWGRWDDQQWLLLHIPRVASLE